MWNESHTNCFDSFLFTLRTIVESVCLLYIWRERNSFSRMSWYFRCYPGSCFVFFLFPFVYLGHLQRGLRSRENKPMLYMCDGAAIDSQFFFFQENNTGRRRKKFFWLLLCVCVCVCFGSAPAIRPRCDEFNAFEWGGPSTFPPPRFWSLLVRGITQTRATVCCVWSYPLRQEGLRSNGNIIFNLNI